MDTLHHLMTAHCLTATNSIDIICKLICANKLINNPTQFTCDNVQTAVSDLPEWTVASQKVFSKETFWDRLSSIITHKLNILSTNHWRQRTVAQESQARWQVCSQVIAEQPGPFLEALFPHKHLHELKEYHGIEVSGVRSADSKQHSSRPTSGVLRHYSLKQ